MTKFRIILSLLVLLVIGITYFIYEQNQTPTKQQDDGGLILH